MKSEKESKDKQSKKVLYQTESMHIQKRRRQRTRMVKTSFKVTLRKVSYGESVTYMNYGTSLEKAIQSVSQIKGVKNILRII